MSAQGVRALIMDDNPLHVDVLRIMLDRLNVKSITDHSLREADTIIMPQLVGAPIVAEGVHTSEIDRAPRLGFDSFLGKPLNAQRFPQQLHDHPQRRSCVGGVNRDDQPDLLLL